MAVRYEELRLDHDKKQEEIADVLNVKRSTYSKWENETNDIPIKKAVQLADYYNVSVDYLLGLSDNKKVILSDKEIHWDLLPIRILELRKKAGLTQQDIGNKIGFPQTTYCDYEMGRRRSRTFKLMLICKFYNISFDYLIGRSFEMRIK